MNQISLKENIIALLTAETNDCQQFFDDNNMILESAYYDLVHKNLIDAKKKFFKIQGQDIRAHWGHILISLIQDSIEGFPSYFELRNFYEVDLEILFTYYLGDYIEKICKYSDWLYTINPEIYKYTGRAFLKNNYDDIGIYFLNKATEKFYNDPELHYLLAEYNIKIKDYNKAISNIQNCLTILPEYYPAIKLEKEIDKYCK